MSDELLARLAAARPELSADLLEPDNELLEEILMSTEKTKRRFVTPLRLSAVAAVAAALVGVALIAPNENAPKIVRPPIAVNMRTIAESTGAALSSGRAHLTYTTNNGHFIHDSGSFVIEFSGENRSTVGTMDPGNPCEDASVSVPQERCDAQSFEVANKVVDGKFYLRDGVPGQQTWIEDTNEHVTGSDLFSVDPRLIVSGAAQDAAFKDVGTATVDGVSTHHLKATRLDQVPRVNLGLGPIADDQTKVTKFDVWVDADNVVRRLAISTSQTQTVYPLAKTQIVKKPDGSIQKTLDTTNVASEQRTTVNDYSVVFTDIGAPITIEAPANAKKVAGQG